MVRKPEGPQRGAFLILRRFYMPEDKTNKLPVDSDIQGPTPPTNPVEFARWDSLNAPWIIKQAGH